MTQHGSFPGRPRGRRARHEADVPEGQGYDATPQTSGSSPTCPDPAQPGPGARRPRAGRLAGHRAARSVRAAGPGSGAQPGPGGYGGGYPARPVPATGSRVPARPARATGSRAQSGQPGYGGGQYGGGHGGPGQAPWADQAWPDQTSAGQPGATRLSRRRLSRPSLSRVRPATQPQWTDAQQGRQEEDVPSWAEPDSVEAFSARWHRRGLDSRDDRRTDRRKRRRLLIAIGGALAVVIAVAVYFLESAAPTARPTWASARW